MPKKNIYKQKVTEEEIQAGMLVIAQEKKEKYDLAVSHINQRLDEIKYTNGNIRTINHLNAYTDIIFGAETLGDNKMALQYAPIITEWYINKLTNPKDHIFTQINIQLDTLVKENPKEMRKLYDKIFECFAVRARARHFDSYIIALEFYRKDKDKFYLPRREVLLRHNIIQDIQDLLDGNIRMLVIEAPPGIGKSLIGELYCTLKAGLDNTARQLFGNASADLTQGFYNDILNFITNGEYAFAKIFKKSGKIIPSAEGYSIYFNIKGREPNLMFRSIFVGATGKIHLNEQGGLYMDDMVGTPEQVRNPDTLRNIYNAYKDTFLDRRDNINVPILLIGTPWSTKDPIGVVKSLYSDKEWFRLNSTPCYKELEDGTKITNFDYKVPHYKSVEFWDEQIEASAEETDNLIASAKFLMRPLEKEGRPFAQVTYFEADELFDRLKRGEKPFVFSATDTAIRKKGDYLSNGYFYYFAETGDIYLRDVIHSNLGSDHTIPRIIEKHLMYKVERSEIEEKEGATNKNINFGIGYTIKKNIDEKGLLCLLKVHNAAGLDSKANRIGIFEEEIKGNKTVRGYALKFLCKKDRQGNADYNKAMQHLEEYTYNAKKNDDFPDMISQAFSYCISTKPKSKCEVISARDFMPRIR